MRTRTKVLIDSGSTSRSSIVMHLTSATTWQGSSSFSRRTRFKLDPLGHAPDRQASTSSINKAVLYLLLASGLTVFTMVWISRRMDRPPRVQTVDRGGLRPGARTNITVGNLEGRLAARWFPFLAALFFFIWFSNMTLQPLPTNTEHEITVFRPPDPRSRSTRPLRNILDSRSSLTPVVMGLVPRRGIRAKGFIHYSLDGCCQAWRK